MQVSQNRAMRVPRLLLIVGSLSASGLAIFFGSGVHPAWWFTWIAPLPVLLLARYLTGRRCFIVASSAWFLGGFNEWKYLHRVLEIPALMVVISLLVPAFIFGVGTVLFRHFLIRNAIWRAATIFATVWVSYEYLLAEISPHSTFGNLAYTQMNAVAIVQLASVTGVWGISFLLLFVPAAVAAMLGSKAEPHRRRLLIISAIAVVVAVVGFGEWRLYTAPPTTTVKVGLMASDVRASLFPQKDNLGLAVYREYSARLDLLAKQGAEVIVLPEKIALLSDAAVQEMDQLFATAAALNKVSVVVGVDHTFSDKKALNQAKLFSPDGTLVAEYDKHHLVPVFEARDRPGINRSVWEHSSGKWGLQVCKDMDFPKLSREYGREGTALMLVPAWDFVEDDWLHSRMAIMRSVEDGFAMVRSAKQGLLTVNDDRGRVLAQQSSSAAPFSILIASVSLGHSKTVYSRFGDWFAWLNIVLLLATVSIPAGRSDKAPRTALASGSVN